MSWDHLPIGMFRETLERNGGKFPSITNDEISTIQHLAGDFSELVEIIDPKLTDFVKQLADFWGMPAPKLYHAKDSNFELCLPNVHSASLLLGRAYNTLDTPYLKAAISHEFFHGLQDTRRDPLKPMEYHEFQAFHHKLEYQADVHGAAFTSIETKVATMEKMEASPENTIYPSQQNRIKHIIEIGKTKEWQTWQERHDQKSLTQLMEASDLLCRQC